MAFQRHITFNSQIHEALKSSWCNRGPLNTLYQNPLATIQKYTTRCKSTARLHQKAVPVSGQQLEPLQERDFGRALPCWSDEEKERTCEKNNDGSFHAANTRFPRAFEVDGY